MSNRRKLTQEEILEIARGIADGRDMIEIAGRIGVDRTTLSGWMRRESFLYEVVEQMTSPDELGANRLASLRNESQHRGERHSAWMLRLEFWEVVRYKFPVYFEKERRAMERARRERLRPMSAAMRKREDERDRIWAECHAADAFNFATLLEVQRRNWRDGTADELERGLDTPEKRRRYRCSCGIRWDCAGFGAYYAQAWDANLCRMEYDEDGAGFDALYDCKTFARLWEDHLRNPFGRRDPRLPVTPDKAEALLRRIEKGENFGKGAD